MPAETVTATWGPWRRVVDTGRAGKPDPEVLRDAVDAVLAPSGAAVSRPGIHARARHPGYPGEPQGFAQVELAGTVWTLGVVGGVLAAYDWTADAWTVLAHAGTTLNVTGAVALAGFFDQLVVSDGVNRPWRTTLGSGTGAFLPTSGPLYGRLVVKDAKLFGILANDRRTAVWSEEADLAIGFDTAGYNNAWDLRQTSQAALVALVAGEEGLRFQREASTGMIQGAVNDEFQASGTFDSVARDFGTVAPFAPVLTEGGVLWSVDRLGRPYRVGIGTGVDTLWLACDATVATVDRDRLAYAWGLHLPDGDVVAFALPRTPGSLRNTDLLRFDRASGDYLGRWTLPTGGAWAWFAVATGDDGVARLAGLDQDGRLHVVWTDAEADASAAKALDAPATGPAALPPTRVVTSEAQQAGAEQAAWCQWMRLIFEAGDPWGGTVPPVQQAASTGTSVALDTEEPGHAFGTRPERRIRVKSSGKGEADLKRFGRWIRAAVRPRAGADAAGSERFRVWKLTIVGAVRDASARRR